MAFYRGISLRNYEINKSYVLKDVELVKQDILNNIFTEKLTRIMMPKYGTSINRLLFRPMDFETLSLLEEEILTVLQNDPRVEVLDFEVEPQFSEKAVYVRAKLLYVEINYNDTLEIRLEFDG